MAIYGLTGGTLIVAGVVIATLLAVVYATFTYRGRSITPHAGDQTGDAPSAADPSDPAGEGRTTVGTRPPAATAPATPPAEIKHWTPVS